MSNDEQLVITPPEATPAPARKSWGEKAFDWLVYGGLNGVGTFFATIPLAYWAKHGEGAKAYQSIAKKAEATGLNAAHVEDVLKSGSLGLGGTLMLVPVRWAESKRPQAVEWLNQHAPQSQDPVSRETVIESPKQTWGSLLLGRLTAWGAVFVSFKLAGSLTSFLGHPNAMANFESWFAKDVVCKPMGKPTHIHGVETKLYRYGKIAALDIFATAAASSILLAGSRFFAKQTPEAEQALTRSNDQEIQHDASSPSSVTQMRVYEERLSQPVLTNGLTRGD